MGAAAGEGEASRRTGAGGGGQRRRPGFEDRLRLLLCLQVTGFSGPQEPLRRAWHRGGQRRRPGSRAARAWGPESRALEATAVTAREALRGVFVNNPLGSSCPAGRHRPRRGPRLVGARSVCARANRERGHQRQWRGEVAEPAAAGALREGRSGGGEDVPGGGSGGGRGSAGQKRGERSPRRLGAARREARGQLWPLRRPGTFERGPRALSCALPPW